MLNTLLKKSSPLLVPALAGALLIGCDTRPAQDAQNSATPAVSDGEVSATPASTGNPAESLTDHMLANEGRPAAQVKPDASPAAKPARPSEQVTPMVASTLKVEPAILDLGEIATGDTGMGTVTLTNIGEETLVITRVKPTCGCTTARLEPNTPLSPGESIEMDIKLKGGTKPTRLNKQVRYLVEGQQPKVLQVKAQSIAFVMATPDQVNPKEHETVTFTSRDESPFRITSMSPDVIPTQDLPAEAKTEHTIALDYDRWRELGANARITVYTDHPKCNSLPLMLARSAEDIRIANEKTGRDQMQKKPTPPGEIAPARQTQIQLAKAAIAAGNGEKVLQMIASGDIAVDARDRQSSTLLMIAADKGDVETMLGLMDAGADLDAVDRNGHTTLMKAAMSGNVEAVRVVLDAGADVNARDNLDGTALANAAMKGDAETAQELLDAGAQVGIVQRVTGFTPLTWVSIAGDPEIIPLLLDAGSNIEHQDMLEGATPLIHAARTGKPDSVRHLVEAGANINARDRNGKTPLLACVSATSGTIEKIKLLQELGADVKATDARGKNAVDFAMDRTDARADEVVAYLESLGLSASEKTNAPAKPKPAPRPASTGVPHDHDGDGVPDH